MLTFVAASCGDPDSSANRRPDGPIELPTTTAGDAPTPAVTSPPPRPTHPGPSATSVPAGGSETLTTPAPLPHRPDAVDYVALAINDLAGRLDVDPSQIGVVDDKAVTWRDGSLGCPELGMNYTQALVPGRRIVLDHAGQFYRYHGALDREPFPCPTHRATEPAPNPDT